jgi:hypothetical protein
MILLKKPQGDAQAKSTPLEAGKTMGRVGYAHRYTHKSVGIAHPTRLEAWVCKCQI